MEQNKIAILKARFYQIIEQVKEYSEKNINESLDLINNLERLLLNHEIRGKTIMSEVAATETVGISIESTGSFLINSNYSIENYMEDVLNNKIEPVDNIKITILDSITKKYEENCKSDMLYLHEIAQLPPRKSTNSRKEYEDNVEPMNHFVDSIMAICDSDDDNVAIELDPIFKLSDTSIDTLCNQNALKDILNDSSRWCCLTQNLEMMSDSEFLLNKTIRISSPRRRSDHVISAGGNFMPVELGLDINNKPLAVKRIPRDSNICVMIKNKLDTLLPLKDDNILHYFACDYDHNELILAAPLCEYNIGQYIMMMKQGRKSLLSSLDIVIQFLRGVLFLHEQNPNPIVHGNLKPSNIFVDLNHNVKVAEFGIHQVTLKLS